MSEEITLSTIEAAVEAIGRGEIIIVMDDEDRENEGDFICAAEKVTPEVVNFMITHGRGLPCVPILPEVCRRLDLPPMVDENSAPLGTSFTVPVDHRVVRHARSLQRSDQLWSRRIRRVKHEHPCVTVGQVE